jgi:hypothetical protein
MTTLLQNNLQSIPHLTQFSGQSQVSPTQVQTPYQQQVLAAPSMQMQDLGSQVYNQQFLRDNLMALIASGQVSTPTNGVNMGYPQQMPAQWSQGYSNQYQNPYQNQYQPNLQALQNENRLAAELIGGLNNELKAAYDVINQLLPIFDDYYKLAHHTISYEESAKKWKYVANSLANYGDQCEYVISQLRPFVDIANIWMVDSNQHQIVLEQLLWCLTDPAFQAYWAFNVLGKELLEPYQGMIQQTQQPQNNFVPRPQGFNGFVPQQATLPFPQQSINTPVPTSYSGNNVSPIQAILTAYRTQGVNGITNARKAGMI